MYMLITCESSGDVNSYFLLSPMQLLTMKTKVVMPPPGIFQKEDLYCHKQWRHVQDPCVMSFGQDGEKKFMQHRKLNRSGIR